MLTLCVRWSLMVGLGRGRRGDWMWPCPPRRAFGGRGRVDRAGRAAAAAAGQGASVHGVQRGEASLIWPVFGRPVRLVWRKRRWLCPHQGRARCARSPIRTLGHRAAQGAHDQLALLAGRPAGRARDGRSKRSRPSWAATGTPLWPQCSGGAKHCSKPTSARTEGVTALGLDEILMFRRGPYREQAVGHHHRGRQAGQAARHSRWSQAPKGPHAGSAGAPRDGGGGCAGRVMDLSGPYRKAFTDSPCPTRSRSRTRSMSSSSPTRTVDEVRRRVQNETTGGRGTKHDALVPDTAAAAPRHTNASPNAARRSCAACSPPATPAARSATHGTPRRPCG